MLSSQDRLSLRNSTSRHLSLVLIFAVIIITLALIFSKTYTQYKSFADTISQDIEPENGTISGNISLIDNPSASGGKYIVFADSANQTTCSQFPLVRADNSALPRGNASEADQFVDSIGVVYKFNDSKYFTQWAKDRLAELGVRHLRGALAYAVNHISDINQINQQTGAKFTFLANGYFDKTDPQNMTGSQVHQAILSIGSGLFDGVEGSNEPENFDPNTDYSTKGAHARDHQIDIFQSVKGDPNTSSVRVLGPAISPNGVGKIDIAIGNIDAYIDSVNLHPYVAGKGDGRGPYYSPENPTQGALRVFASIPVLGSYSEPVIGTEMGYSTQPINPPFSDADQAKAIYMPRAHLYLFNHGMWRTYSYAFIDNATGGSDKENNFGYIKSDGTPKQSFYSMKNLITLLKDPGPRFVPSPLNYSVSGNISSLQEVLLEKRDGSYYLALWIGKELDLNNPSNVPVTISFSQPMSSIDIATPNDSDAWSSIGSGSSINLNISDKVLLLKLVPQSPQTPQSCIVH